MKMETSLRVINKESLMKTSLLNHGGASDATIESVKQNPPTTQESTSLITTTGKDVGKNNKQGSTKSSVSFEDKHKKEPDIAVTELLGSVTTHNCPGVRTSARVIQKMKQDQIRPTTPPPSERDHKHKDERPMQKTPSQVRANKPIWTNIERNHFFDAVNEFGKDFEAIGNYINTKLKRKSGTDAAFKTKDQVRQHYYTTFHKICKHIRFSDEVKKPAQEMYALINYGEMRRKLQFVTDKHFFKMKNLVYHGQVIVRCKGKNIRIKTPSCKALRRLNQLDDSLEDIRLPSKIEVIVTPANMEAFGRVQTIAQNPRARATVPLHKKLINFIKNFQHKWRSAEIKYVEEEAKLFPTIASANSSNQDQNHVNDTHQHDPRPMSTVGFQDPEMCFLPKPGVTIHRPLLSITECLSSVNICLSAYEDRMGIKVSGETLCPERPTNKRQRTESGSEKRSPDAKKQKSNLPMEKTEAAVVASELQPCLKMVKEENNSLDLEITVLKTENSGISCNGQDLNDELNDLLSEVDLKEEAKIEQPVLQLKEEPLAVEVVATTSSAATTNPPSINLPANNPNTSNGRSKRTNNSSKVRSTLTFKPLISEDVIKRIRKGWTVSNAADITIGDLYVVFGHDCKLELDYFWTNKTTPGALMARPGNSEQTEAAASIFSQKQSGVPYNPSECDDPQLMQTLSKSNISNKLKHLLLIANLSERIRKRQCSCGHTCEKSAKARIERDLATKTFISNKTFLPNTVSSEGSNLFRQPIVPMRRTVFNMDSVKQLTAVSRPKMSRQVLVQRLLLPGGVNHQELFNVKQTQNSTGVNQDKIQNSNQLMRAPSTNTFRPKNLSHAKPKASTSNTKSMQPTVEFSGNLAETTVSSCSYGQDVESNIVSDIFELPGTHITTNQSVQHDIEIAKNINNFSCSTPAPSLPDSAFDEASNTSVFNEISPMHLIRDSSSNSRWLEENLNDFSLTSLLGHLDDINSSRDILDPSSNLSVISETSVDYMSKFQEITALMRSQDND